jgi:hypothetical protein
MADETTKSEWLKLLDSPWILARFRSSFPGDPGAIFKILYGYTVSWMMRNVAELRKSEKRITLLERNLAERDQRILSLEDDLKRTKDGRLVSEGSKEYFTQRITSLERELLSIQATEATERFVSRNYNKMFRSDLKMLVGFFVMKNRTTESTLPWKRGKCYEIVSKSLYFGVFNFKPFPQDCTAGSNPLGKEDIQKEGATESIF